MYKPSKRVLSACLVAGMIFSVAGVKNVVEAGQTYDSTNVGIANKVGEYIEETTSADPVSDLSDGAVSVKDIEVASEPVAEEVVAEDSSATDASVTDASPTDAKIYTQFQDRAVCTAEGKVNIRTEPSTDAEVIGVIDRGGICLVDEIDGEWTKIESGTCEGYVASMYLAYGDDAGVWCENNGITRRATVTTTTLKVRESKDENSECVTLIPEGEDYYVYSVSDDWVEVLIDDDFRGFVKAEYVDVEFQNTRAVSVEEQAEADRKAKEEQERAWLEYLAQQEAAQQAAAVTAGNTQDAQQTADNTQIPAAAAPEPAADNTQPAAEAPAAAEPATEAPAAAEPAGETYYEVTEAPTTEATYYAAPAGQSGVDLVNYASQFVGNPYVWGGTSLTNGADCSGFVMTIYAQWGYSLPHNAAMQSNYGVEVSLSDLQAGDLLFYSNGGGISHVAIYRGDGTIVHAASSRDGIKISAYNYHTPCKAVRILGQ